MVYAKQLRVTRNYELIAPCGVTIAHADDLKLASSNAEDTELINFVSWFKREHKHLKDLLVHIPNESMKPVQGRVIDAKKGLLANAPDLLIMTSPPLAIEMKRENWKLSLSSTKDREHCEKQMDILSEWSKHGANCYVTFGANAAKEIVKKHCNK